VLGIVAGRLADLYARPALLIALGDDPAPGSGRSVPGFPLHEALRACGDGLASHGGHAAAAGFKVPHAHVDVFRELFCAYAARRFAACPPVPTLVLDAEVPLSAVTHGFVKDLGRLEPYGSQNPRPLFLAGNLEVVGTPRKVGHGERHLSFRVRQQGTTLRAIAFNLADRCEELLSAGGACCLVFTPRFNEWQGYTHVDLDVQDFQPGPRARLG
jgi:single-stranded-DNA-specific exonuclease